MKGRQANPRQNGTNLGLSRPLIRENSKNQIPSPTSWNLGFGSWNLGLVNPDFLNKASGRPWTDFIRACIAGKLIPCQIQNQLHK